jgi:hypothetical protein
MSEWGNMSIRGLLFQWASSIKIQLSLLLFNINSAIFQLYHGENKVIFNEIDDEVRFVLDQQA